MEGDAGKGMSRRLGAGNDESFDFVLKAANRFLGLGKFIGVIDLVANCWIGFGFMGQLGIRGDANGQGFATLVVGSRSAKNGEQATMMVIPLEDQSLSSSLAPTLQLTMAV